jgi:hypothetical protein
MGSGLPLRAAKARKENFYNRWLYVDWVIFLSVGFRSLLRTNLLVELGKFVHLLTNVSNHVLAPIDWLLIIFVPIAGMLFDVVGKVYSNVLSDTTQIL